MRNIECSNCKFWHNWTTKDYGECKYNPPVFIPRPENPLRSEGNQCDDTYWPVTGAFDWCGKHEWRPEHIGE